MKTRKAPPQLGSVYFIEAVGANLVKIGFTRRGFVSQRVRELETSCPYELKVLRVFDGTRGDEKRAHVKFAKWHKIREWFTYSDEIREFIQGEAT